MDGASRAFAAPTTVTLGGVEYTVRPRVAAYYGEMEAHLLSKRENPMQVAKESIVGETDPAVITQIIEVAMAERCRAKSVTRRELAEWMDSMDGTAFVSWLQIRHNDPTYNESNPGGSATTITPAFIKEKMLDDFEQALNAIIATIEGISIEDAMVAAESQIIDRVQSQLGAWVRRGRLGKLDWPEPDGGGGPGDLDKPIPWRRIIRRLANDFGFTAAEVGQMTLYQIKIFLRNEKDLGGEYLVSAAEWRRMKRERARKGKS